MKRRKTSRFFSFTLNKWMKR